MMKKRIFSLLLTVAMLISTLPVIANAADQPTIAKTSLTLDGVIGLNVKVDSHSNDMSGYKVKVTIDGDTASQVIDAPSTEPDTGRYVYTAKLPAHKLPKAVQIELLDSSDTPVDTKTGWTAASYLTGAVEIDSGLADLAAALNLYGDNAAAYGTSAGSAPAQAVEQSDLESHRFELVQGSTALNPCAELRLHYACAIRVTFAQTEWENGGYTFLFDGQEKAVQLDTANHVYYYETDAIKVQDWGTKYNVKVVKTDAPNETVFECNYGALSYVYTALGLSEERTVGEGNLLKAMFRYYETADGYAKADRYDYSVTYNANYEGSEATKRDEENATNITAASKEFTVDANTFERTGYTFDGWNTEADGTGTAYAAGDKLTVHSTDGAVVLYAQWKSVAQGEVTLVNEDFSGGLPATWSLFDNGAATEDNVWTVTDGALKYTGTSGANSAALSDTAINVDNYELTADITIPSAGSIGLVWGASDDAETMHYFRIFANLGQYKLYAGKITGGLDGSMGTAVANAVSVNDYVHSTQVVTIKIKVEGRSFTIYGDDVPWATGSTTDANLHGRVGAFLRNGNGAKAGAAFDNFKVTSADVLIQEDFNAGTLPTGWAGFENAAAKDVWTVTDGKATYTGTDATNNKVLLSDVAINTENYTLTAEVYLPAVVDSKGGGLSVGLVFGSNDAGTKFHVVRTNLNQSNGATTGYIGYTNDGKTVGTITSTNVTSKVEDYYGQMVTVKVVVKGLDIQFYVEDALLLSATTTQIVADLTGKVGFFIRGNVETNYFDNIMVEKITVTAG